MSKSKDRAIIHDAAEQWGNELVEYIIPGVLTKEERKSYRKQADKLHAALAREQGRARRKANRERLHNLLTDFGTMPASDDRSPEPGRVTGYRCAAHGFECTSKIALQMHMDSGHTGCMVGPVRAGTTTESDDRSPQLKGTK